MTEPGADQPIRRRPAPIISRTVAFLLVAASIWNVFVAVTGWRHFDAMRLFWAAVCFGLAWVVSRSAKP